MDWSLQAFLSHIYLKLKNLINVNLWDDFAFWLSPSPRRLLVKSEIGKELLFYANVVGAVFLKS